MATTTNYGWTTPDDTALVKDGAAAIRTLGSSVDTTTKALNPSTTLGDIEYRSSTANTNTRLGIGTTGQVLAVTGGVPSWVTPAGGGKVLQVVNATSATQTSNSTSTYADTTLTATITPTLATSKVLVLVNQAGGSRGNQDDQNSLMVRLLRGATEIVPDFVGKAGANMGANYTWMGGVGNTNFLDSPATTSATTYKTQFRNGRNGAVVTVQTDSATSTITLLEIGA
jgi:hypothetical protein